jgi:hypothetical protein
MTIDMMIVVCRTCPDLSFFLWGVSTSPFIFKRGEVTNKLQHDPNQNSISTYLFNIYYIYIIIYTLGSKTCSSEIFQMVGRVIVDPSLGLLGPCRMVPRVLILVSIPRVFDK